MDAYEATKIVYQRIQSLDPENASKIMGVLLIQDHGEKEMIRLAFGPESLVHSVILKARKELGFSSPSTPSTPNSPSPFGGGFSRQNSTSSVTSGGRILGGINLPSPLSITSNNNQTSTVSASWSTTPSSFSDFQEDLVSPSAYASNNSTMNSSAPPFYCSGEVDLIDEFQLQDQLSFLNDGSPTLGPKNPDVYYPQQQDLASSPSGDSMLFSSYNWGGGGGGGGAVNGLPHRRSCSVSDICLGGDDPSGGFGWKPCLYYARGYCKNGTSCRFLHGGGPGDVVSEVGSPSKFEMMEHCQELLRSKSAQQQRLATASQLMASSNFPFSPMSASKCMNFLQQQQLQQSAESPRAAAAAALMMGDDMHKLSRSRFERGDFGLNGGTGIANPGSRQIYLTFPADSTFKEEDVSNYFSTYGPVQDVRIPYQQKRMFGFVTFVYPETVKTILAKGNPHFVCDARVLVKPYKEKGKVPEKFRKQQMERGEFNGCGSPTGLESGDPYDLHLGARMFYNSQDMMLRRKLEEQADLQQAIELQSRRLMNLQLLDVKRSTHHRALSMGAVIPSPPHSPGFFNQNMGFSPNFSSREVMEENGFAPKVANLAAFTAEKEVQQNANFTAKEREHSPVKDENSNGKENSKKEENVFQESLEHNLPDSPFASPKAAAAVGDLVTTFTNDAGEADKGAGLNAPSASNNMIPSSSLFPATNTLDMTPFKSCYFQVPRFPSGHGTIGM